MNAYLELTKPRLIMLALVTAVCGYFMGLSGPVQWTRLGVVLMGSALLGGGVNALNQYLEREPDGRMERTSGRPLPDGRLESSRALAFGTALTLAGLGSLWVWVGPATAWAGVAVLISYVFIYTPLKRKTPWNTFAGAVTGALPAMMGWAASGGAMGLKSGILFSILFLWQLPHFFAIAWVYREDYRRGGFRMLTLSDDSGVRTGRQIVVGSAALFAASLLPAFNGMASMTYLFMAIFFGIILVGLAVSLAVNGMRDAKKFVIASIVYLLLLNVSMIIDKT